MAGAVNDGRGRCFRAVPWLVLAAWVATVTAVALRWHVSSADLLAVLVPILVVALFAVIGACVVFALVVAGAVLVINLIPDRVIWPLGRGEGQRPSVF